LSTRHLSIKPSESNISNPEPVFMNLLFPDGPDMRRSAV
jgi:hypothetical protein